MINKLIVYAVLTGCVLTAGCGAERHDPWPENDAVTRQSKLENVSQVEVRRRYSVSRTSRASVECVHLTPKGPGSSSRCYEPRDGKWVLVSESVDIGF